MEDTKKNGMFECPPLVSAAAAATILWAVLTAVIMVYGAALLSMSGSSISLAGHKNSINPATYWSVLVATVVFFNGSGILFSVYALRGRMWAYLCACLWLLLNLFIEAFPLAAGKPHEIAWMHVGLVILALAFWLVPYGQFQMFSRNQKIPGSQTEEKATD
jgi:hypothetical protein